MSQRETDPHEIAQMFERLAREPMLDPFRSWLLQERDRALMQCAIEGGNPKWAGAALALTRLVQLLEPRPDRGSTGGWVPVFGSDETDTTSTGGYRIDPSGPR